MINYVRVTELIEEKVIELQSAETQDDVKSVEEVSSFLDKEIENEISNRK